MSIRNLSLILVGALALTVAGCDDGRTVTDRDGTVDIHVRVQGADWFRVARIEDLPFDPSSVDLVMLNAVLHFARDADHFNAMVNEAWRVLAPGGIFFARLASNIGIQDKVQHLGNGRFLLPDETERYLVDQRMLLKTTRDLEAELIEPIKTTLVQDMRSMTTWVMRKPEA